jgi:hypothetical protein
MGTLWGSIDPTVNHEDYFFNPPQKQFYFMLQTNWQPKQNIPLMVNTSIAVDRGNLFNNIGFMIGITWSISSQFADH